MAESLSIKDIRERLGWTQGRMAEHLGLHRTRVSRMENGQEPTGPVAKLLEQLKQELPEASASKLPTSKEAAA